jgi:DNA end-binding protein Ku
VDLHAIDIARFERPYVVVPEGRDATEIYAVMQKALMDGGKAGLGQIAMRGREELCALYAVEDGLMLSTLRYDAELEEPSEALRGTLAKKPKTDSIELMRQLITEHSSKPDFAKFHDHYHEAPRELVKAKQAHREPRMPKAVKPTAKVVNLMDALKKSLGSRGHAASSARRRRSA